MSAETKDRGNAWYAATLLLGAALVLGALVTRRSPVIDEPFHLVRGLAFWQEHDTRLSYAHPPLINAWSALPASLLGGTEGGLSSIEGWAEHDSSEVGNRYFARSYERARSQTLVARNMIVVLTLGLLLYVYRLARRFWEPRAALFALALLACNPTLLAHGALNTNDLGATLFFVLIVGETLGYLVSSSRWALGRQALALSLAAIAKFNLLPFVALAPVIALGAAYTGVGRFAGAPRKERVRRAALEAVLVGGCVLLVINAAYFFEGTGFTRESLREEPAIAAVTADRIESGFVGHLPEWLPVPLPTAFCAGLAFVGRHMEAGHESWFFGESTKTGSAWYFPVMLLIKTPVSYWLLLTAAGVATWARSRRPQPAGDAARGDILLAAVLLGSVIYLGLLLGSRINIGVRHALPLVPCLALLAGRAAARLWHDAARWPDKQRWTRGSVLAVVALTGVAPFAHYPDYLGYFNALVGRRSGHRIGIIGEDWGQDLIDLAYYAQASGIRHLHYHPYPKSGAQELRRAAIEVTPIDCESAVEGPAYIAVHASRLARRKRCYPWRTNATLVDTLNDHIRLYELPEPPKPPKPAKPAKPRVKKKKASQRK